MASPTRLGFVLPALAGLMLSLPLYALGALLSGGGHTLATLLAFFPYGVVWGHLFGDTRWAFVAMILLVIQLPLYATFAAGAKGRLKALPLLFIFAAHTLGVLTGFSVGVK